MKKFLIAAACAAALATPASAQNLDSRSLAVANCDGMRLCLQALEKPHGIWLVNVCAEGARGNTWNLSECRRQVHMNFPQVTEDELNLCLLALATRDPAAEVRCQAHALQVISSVR